MKKKRSYWKPLSGIFIFLFAIALWDGCSSEGRGFALPEGDMSAGKAAFVKLQCNQCHSVGSIQWKQGEDEVHVELGGTTNRVRTYGELVTSIINPSHRVAINYTSEGTTPDGASRMRNYNEVMTVQELVDIVTFLQSEYKIKSPDFYYPGYY